MGIFEGKTPAERNKIIAAIVLGALAVISLTYTFGGSLFGSGGGTDVTVDVEATPTPPTAGEPGTDAAREPITAPDEDAIYQEYAVIPLDYAPLNDFGPIGGRNIFAFYEPPAPTPPVPVTKTPTPPPTFTPAPPPTPYPLTVAFISPQSVYAGTSTFRLEVSGENFTPASKIVFNGVPLQTNFVSEQRLSAEVPAALIRNAASFSVYVDTFDGTNFSNQIAFIVQAPPKPQVEYIGMIARKHYNNDTAYFQKGANDEPVGKRLNDIVDNRFRLVSISEREVELEDIRLGFRHKLEMKRPDATSAPAPRGRINNAGPRTITRPVQPQPVQPQPVQPAANTDCVPGIPCDLPRATPRPRPNPPVKKQDIDN